MSELPSWQRLDNAGKLFPSITTTRQTHIFRLSATMKEAVNPKLLQQALTNILPRFPLFRYRLHAGFFWYSLVFEPAIPQIFPDSASPCMPFRERHPHLFRVRWYAKRLAVEFSHSLTDGMGAGVFFKALVCEYLAVCGLNAQDWLGIPRSEEHAPLEESEDAVRKLFIKGYPRSGGGWNRAFIVPFSILPRGFYRVISGQLPLKETLAEAKKHQLTLNEFLTVIYFMAFQDVFESLPTKAREKHARDLRIVVPVNLRKLFPSATLRNFFIVLSLELDLRLGHYSFSEVARKVHHQLQSEMDAKLILKQVARNLRGEIHPLSRVAPLFLKNLVLSSIFATYERQHTSSISNLGKMDFPVEFAQAIESCEFIPPPSPYTKVNAGVVSFGDTLCISFGSMTERAAVERSFFTQLRKMGLSVKLQSNHDRLEEM